MKIKGIQPKHITVFDIGNVRIELESNKSNVVAITKDKKHIGMITYLSDEGIMINDGSLLKYEDIEEIELVSNVTNAELFKKKLKESIIGGKDFFDHI